MWGSKIMDTTTYCNVYFTILINILYLHLSMVKNSYIIGNVIQIDNWFIIIKLETVIILNNKFNNPLRS